MIAERNIKYVVKVLFITRPLHKLHFTVRHPESALFLTGIFATTSKVSKGAFGDGGTPNDAVGALSLAIPQKGDVFYNEAIFCEPADYNGDILRAISSDSISNMSNGIKTKKDYFRTSVPICEAMMEGFYEDAYYTKPLFPPKLAEPIGIIPLATPLKILYKISLYLRYEMKPEEIEEIPVT